MTTTTPMTSSNTPAAPRIASGPRGHLLLGVLPEARRDVLGLLTRVRREYGDVARYRVGPTTSHLISHPDGVRHVLQEHVKNYTKDHFSYRLVSRVAGNGLLTSQGSFWLRQRRLAQPAFHRQRIAAMAEEMTRATARMLEGWDASAARGEPVVMVEEMMRLTLSIVGAALFGTSVGDKAEVVGSAFNVLSEQTVTRFRTMRLLPPVLPTRYDREFRAASRALRGAVMDIIAERRQRNEDRGDLLSMFMLARDEETGETMTDEQLRDEVLTMLVAGHETTSTAMSWVWALLDQHPHVEAKLHAELDAVLEGRLPTAADVGRLAYTRMVVEEAMRLYPPAYIFSRAVKEDDVIGGFRIPGGTTVDISPYVTHRHPDFWERPEEFIPERFSPEASAQRPRYAYFPFSGGPRQCIGNGFAIMEAQLILATVAQRFRPRRVPGHVLTPEPLITLRPKGGLPMHLERRSLNVREASAR
ncbi:cytochrome P450 [Pyxidicoccus fallax]|uniref:Cytochrome P450 n=1 Tax=Pyxidicoccus fallax TaxID=394095 RepID=A0A848LBT3_9BACT|nr:cytochrome P450 [Pyxidicoccus fallax]NMO14163.1 cytochrome P450 [Pyxidicoccus fallax]NPC81492.1 cytochrome P450 [Pyxidicoccus fallax]